MSRLSAWMNDAATDFEGFSRWLTKLFRSGVSNGWTVSQRALGANMSVDISVGDGVPMATNTGAWSWITTVENVVIGAASVNNRRDVIVAYTDMSVTNPSTATPNNPGSLKFVAVQGTPATSPSDPSGATIQTAVGAGNPYIILARVSLTSSTTQITNAIITNFNNPIALNIQRLWGGGSNTLGHLVPNSADGTVVVTSTGAVAPSDISQVAFTSLAPTITASTTNPTLGNSTIGGFYQTFGKFFTYHIQLVVGNSGFVAGSGAYRFSLPFNIAGTNVMASGYILDASAGEAGFISGAKIIAANNIEFYAGKAGSFGALGAVFPFALASGDIIDVTIMGERA